jgi:pyrroloquinoline quinone (PQQ) biosynthesis protein C
VEPLSSWVIHKVPNVKVQELSQIGLSTADEATVAQISNLEVHEAIYESFGHKKTWIKGLPFFSL